MRESAGRFPLYEITFDGNRSYLNLAQSAQALRKGSHRCYIGSSKIASDGTVSEITEADKKLMRAYRSQSDGRFPLYEILRGGRPEPVELSVAIQLLESSGVDVRLGNLVVEADASVRLMTSADRAIISDAREHYKMATAH